MIPIHHLHGMSIKHFPLRPPKIGLITPLLAANNAKRYITSTY